MIVLDTCVILRYALDEKGSDEISYFFERINNKRELAIIPATVLSEIVAILAKRNMKDIAIEIEEYLIDIGVKVEPITRDLAVLAGLLKAKYSVSKKGFSYNDALILAVAIENNASIYTFDPEFNGITEVHIKS